MPRLIFVRHGQSEGNSTRTFTDSPAVPLTERGRQQAHDAAERIARRHRPQRVLSSPFTRAHVTAEIIAGRLGLEVEVDSVWREQSLGQLAGRPYDDALSDPRFDPQRRWAWTPPGGESLEDVRARIAGAIDQLLDPPDGELVVVCHAGTMQAVQAHLLGSWEEAAVPPNAGILLIDPTDPNTPVQRTWQTSPVPPG